MYAITSTNTYGHAYVCNSDLPTVGNAFNPLTKSIIQPFFLPWLPPIVMCASGDTNPNKVAYSGRAKRVHAPMGGEFRSVNE